MFNLFENEELSNFSWDQIGNVSRGRQNLGELMPVAIYRMFQFSLRDELTKKFGKEMVVEIFRNAGKTAGEEFAKNRIDLSLPLNEFIAAIQHELEDMKIGVFRMEEVDAVTGAMIMTVSEDLDCSGLPVTGETVCNYDEGFLAGVLGVYTKQEYTVREIDCWATGARVCRFRAEKDC